MRTLSHPTSLTKDCPKAVLRLLEQDLLDLHARIRTATADIDGSNYSSDPTTMSLTPAVAADPILMSRTQTGPIQTTSPILMSQTQTGRQPDYRRDSLLQVDEVRAVLKTLLLNMPSQQPHEKAVKAYMIAAMATSGLRNAMTTVKQFLLDSPDS